MSLSDLTYQLAEWLRATRMPDVAHGLASSSLSQAMQTRFWVIPTLQSLHILSIAALFSSSVFIALRTFGIFGRDRAPVLIIGRFGPWITWGFVCLLLTGGLLVIAEPVRELVNPVFWFKMMLIVVAVCLATYMNRRIARIATPDGSLAFAVVPEIALLLLWILIIFAGRFIGYAPI